MNKLTEEGFCGSFEKQITQPVKLGYFKVGHNEHLSNLIVAYLRIFCKRREANV